MKKIAFLVQDLDSDYFNYMVEGARKFCAKNGYELMIFIVRGKNWRHGAFDYQYYAVLKLVTENNIDGIILAANTYLQYVKNEEWPVLLNKFNFVPFVSIGVSHPGITSVVSENKSALKKLLEHLYSEHERRRFALLVPETTSTDVISRKCAFEEFVQEKGDLLESSRIITANDYTFEDSKQIIGKICEDGGVDFDALVTCSDDLAFGSMAALQDAGFKIPEDISITGFDNQRRCEYSEPPLTSIDQELEEQGYQAASIVAEKIEGKFSRNEETQVPSVPIYRKSCGNEEYVSNRNIFGDEILLLRHKEILSHFHFLLQEMQASLSLTAFKSLLIQYLQDYGIKSCVICLYDNPVPYKRDEDFVLPESARVLIAYNGEGLQEDMEALELNPAKGMIPEGFKFERGNEIVVSSLFNTSNQYGYVAYTPGDASSRMYELIFSATGIALASNRALTLKDLEKDTDSMTGVFNRGGFMSKGQELIDLSISKGESGAVIFGDMDHLKKINDELGHDVGDEAIKAEVKLLKSLFRDSDVIGRLGGDEFAIICPGITLKIFSDVKNRLETITKNYNETSGNPFEVSISLGAAFYNQNKTDLTALLKLADEKQYEEKRKKHAERE